MATQATGENAKGESSNSYHTVHVNGVSSIVYHDVKVQTPPPVQATTVQQGMNTGAAMRDHDEVSALKSSAGVTNQIHHVVDPSTTTNQYASAPQVPSQRVSNQTVPPVAAIPLAEVVVHPSTASSDSSYFSFIPLDYGEAFIIHLLFGWMGALHFRMGRYTLGLIYFFTLGGFLFGYVLDFIRLAPLVMEYNAKRGKLANNESKSTLVWDCYALWVTDFMGIPHFYLKRFGWGCFYFFTVGGFGLAWVLDLVRIPCLVDQYLKDLAKPSPDSRMRFSLLDSYIFWFPPLGILGAHHLYLKDYPRFFLYFFTGGLLGIGWLYDGIRMNSLVRHANGKYWDPHYGDNYNNIPDARLL